jgi:hypothetical protein
MDEEKYGKTSNKRERLKLSNKRIPGCPESIQPF